MHSNLRTWVLAGALAAGAAVGATSIASAANNGATTTANPPAATAGQDPAKMSHGPGETLLTGSTADKVKAAALAAVPGATVIRVETDSAGSPYEAHLQKADGTQVTVKVNASYAATATLDGFGGPGPNGQAPPAPPAGATTQ